MMRNDGDTSDASSFRKASSRSRQEALVPTLNPKHPETPKPKPQGWDDADYDQVIWLRPGRAFYQILRSTKSLRVLYVSGRFRA